MIDEVIRRGLKLNRQGCNLVERNDMSSRQYGGFKIFKRLLSLSCIAWIECALSKAHCILNCGCWANTTEVMWVVIVDVQIFAT